MNEDFGLDVMMEDTLNNGYGYILDAERYTEPELIDDEDFDDDDDYGDDDGDNWSDVDADADTLASCGWGTDEDYGYDGGDGGW